MVQDRLTEFVIYTESFKILDRIGHSKNQLEFFSFTAIEHVLMCNNSQLLVVISLYISSAVEFVKQKAICVSTDVAATVAQE